MATPVGSIRVDRFAVCVTDGVDRVVGATLVCEVMASGEPTAGYTDPAATQEVEWPVLTDITGRAEVWLPVGVYTWTVRFGDAVADGMFASSPPAFGRRVRGAGDAQLVRLRGPARLPPPPPN